MNDIIIQEDFTILNFHITIVTHFMCTVESVINKSANLDRRER